jgi:hypothetical protein
MRHRLCTLDRFVLTLALIGFLIVSYAFLFRFLGRLIR